MFDVALIFLSHVVYYHHLKQIYIYFDLIFIFGSLSIFPAYYWYMKVLTFQSKIDFKDLSLLLPALGISVATIIVYSLMATETRELYVNYYLYDMATWNSATLLIKIQLSLCYLLQITYFIQILFSFNKINNFIKNYNSNIENYYSNLENKTLEWPKYILYSFVITSIFTIITSFLGRSFFDKYPIILLLTGIGYSIFLFVLGYLGNLQNHTINTLEDDEATSPEIEQDNPNKIKFMLQLQRLFEDEYIYKNPDLKISDIASRLNTNRTYVSIFINREYGCSFSMFVNKYRIEEAKKALLNVDCKNLCLEHISTMVGFGSLHSLIRVFKEIENITPGRYRELNFALNE